MATSSRRRIGYAAVTIGLVLVSQGSLESSIAWEHLREPVCVGLAAVCGGVLSHILDGISVTGNRIDHANMSVSIVGACDALNMIAIFCSAVLAFPSTMRARGLALATGVPLLAGVNVLRIVLLFWIGTRSPWAFEMVHMYAFQVLLVATTAGAFFWWARRASNFEARSADLRR